MAAVFAVMASQLLVGPPARAQDAAQRRDVAVLSAGWSFAEPDGASLFAGVCQGCHMHDAEGAVGAGTYPALAGDAALAVAGDVVQIVVHGRRAMPPLAWAMSDDQVVSVVNYVRSHFGNSYADAVTAADVKSARR